MKKIFVSLLVLSLLVTVPVHAETVLNGSSAATVLVNAVISSTFEARIPDSATLSHEATNVVATATGDIGGSEILCISTDDELTMRSTGKDPVTLGVSQDKQIFTSQEVAGGVTSTITIDPISSSMSAGNWTAAMEVNVYLDEVESPETFAAKAALMRGLNFYIAGDSIIDGNSNNKQGVGDYVSAMWGSEIRQDTSVGGALLTKHANATNSIYGLVQASLYDETGYTANSVYVFDGGGNDMIQYEKDPDKFGDLTFDGSGSKSTDVISAYYATAAYILDKQEEIGIEAPIIYILFDTPQYEKNTEIRTRILNSGNNGYDNYFILDLAEILDEADYQSDRIHLKDSAYTKISNEISDICYEYYS